MWNFTWKLSPSSIVFYYVHNHLKPKEIPTQIVNSHPVLETNLFDTIPAKLAYSLVAYNF